MEYLVNALYIVAFSMFIYGLMGLTGPKTAVRGNQIAAVGMLIAVVATLISIRDAEMGGNWILIAAGLVIGVVLGVPPALRTKMTAMPQLVALFNGVGGGTVALIAYAEFLDSDGFTAFQHGESPTVHIVIASLFAAVIGSISFWGSVIAFLKLQETLPGRPIGIGKLQQPLNALLLIAAVAFSVIIGIKAISPEGPTSSLWIVGVLVLSGILGLMVVLPIGGADMPVVISLLNALTGLSAAAAGLALNNQAMIVAGMIVGASGTILTNLMAKAMNRSIPAIVAGGFGGGGGEAASSDGVVRTAKATSAADAAIQMAYANQSSSYPDTDLPSRRLSTRSRTWRNCSSRRRRGQVRHSPGRRPYAWSHERSSRRGGCLVRRDEGNGRHQRRVLSYRCHLGDRCERRHQPGGAQRSELTDSRNADPQRRPVEVRHRAQALDELRFRRYREPALLRRGHLDALR